MTPRQRLLAPFEGRVPDRPALLADLSYWYESARLAGRLPARYAAADGVRRLHADLGVCEYYQAGTSVVVREFDGVEQETRSEGPVRRRSWRTPAGALEDRWEYLPGSACWACTDYPVKTVQDLAVLADLFRRARYRSAYEGYRRQDERLGDAGLPIVPVPRSPLPALLADWCGVEQTIWLLADEPGAVAETLEAIDRAADPAFDLIAAAPCRLLHFCDNLDSAAATPFFEEHMRARYVRRLAQLHAAGQVAVVHLDGRVRGLLPRLAGCGFDGVESITPAPVGDVTVEETRAVAERETLVLWGGLPGAMFCPPWTAEQVREQARRVVRHWGAQGRLVVGTADQIPPDGAVECCRAIAGVLAAGA